MISQTTCDRSNWKPLMMSSYWTCTWHASLLAIFHKRLPSTYSISCIDLCFWNIFRYYWDGVWIARFSLYVILNSMPFNFAREKNKPCWTWAEVKITHRVSECEIDLKPISDTQCLYVILISSQVQHNFGINASYDDERNDQIPFCRSDWQPWCSRKLKNKTEF